MRRRKIIETAEKEKADPIVMGKRGQSLVEKIMIGSVSNHVLRHSPVPVLVTKKRKQKFQVKKILVPTDFTKKEEAERNIAAKLALGFHASLTLLYVLELFGQGIVDYARLRSQDLIVMTTCTSPIGRLFLGSTTEKVISSTDLPVIVVPPRFC